MEGRFIKQFELVDCLSDFDKIISVAKMKTHVFMGVTGAVKNLFGCIVGTDKARFHLRMQKHIDFRPCDGRFVSNNKTDIEYY